MEEKNYAGLIPHTKDGWTITAASEKTEPTEAEAKTLFEIAGIRLLEVNSWADILKGKLAKFQLMDRSGEHFYGPAKDGLYTRIDIVGPGSHSGHGFDWVHIEAVAQFEHQGIEHIAIRVRPSAEPGSGNHDTAHFYSDKTTSTFTVTREGNKVTASVYDRNTEVNTETDNLIDKARNLIIGTAGILGFSKMQWQDLTDSLLEI